MDKPPVPTGRWLRLAAGVVFTGLLIWAPLNFGSTRAGGTEWLTAGCTLATLLWLAAWVASGPRAPLPPGAVASVTLLTLAALPWITGLARLTPMAPFTSTHFAQVAARWPYGIVWRTPDNTLPFILALAAAALPLIDLARHRSWALTFSIALTGTAVAVGLLALLQNYTHAAGIYWRDDGRMPGHFCGTFFHHTAAGAYFNTAWPLAFALTWLAWDHDRPLARLPALALAGLVAAIVLLAAQGSHISRFPQVAALLVAPFLFGSRKPTRRRHWIYLVGPAAAVGLLIAVAGRTTEIGERWQLMFTPAPAAPLVAQPAEALWPGLMRDDLFIAHDSQGGRLGDRGESWRTALRCIADRPFTGHGPGNWMGAASHHTADPFVRTFFQFLQFTHQDLLQFAVEWGVPATLGWWGLLAGSIVMVGRAQHWRSPLHRQLAIAAACGLAAVLLQSQGDFPLQMPAIALNAVVLAALGWAGAGGVPRRRPAPPPPA